MQAASNQNAQTSKNTSSSATVNSHQQSSSSANNSQNAETISNTTALSGSLERQITDRDSLCNNLKQYVNNISLSDVVFIVGSQRLKVTNSFFNIS